MFINALKSVTQCDAWRESDAGFYVQGNGWTINVWEDGVTVSVSGPSSRALVNLGSVRFGNRQAMWIYEFSDVATMLDWVSGIFRALG